MRMDWWDEEGLIGLRSSACAQCHSASVCQCRTLSGGAASAQWRAIFLTDCHDSGTNAVERRIDRVRPITYCYCCCSHGRGARVAAAQRLAIERAQTPPGKPNDNTFTDRH